MLNFFKNRYSKKKNTSDKSDRNLNGFKSLTLSKNVDESIKRIKNALNNSFDVKDRKFRIGGTDILAGVVFIENLVNEDIILDYVIKPLMIEGLAVIRERGQKIGLKLVQESLIGTGGVEEGGSFDKIILAMLSGSTFIVIEGFDKGLIVETKTPIGRNVGEPKTEPSIKGPKEGFVENLRDNLGLIRKRLRDPNLMFETFKIGRRSKTDVVVIYIKGIVQENIVREVRKRIEAIDTDDGTSSSQIAHLINDSPNSIFPLIQSTERPDKVVPSLLEGRVAIVMDGTPDAILLPVTLPILMQSVDDYYEQWIIGTIIRIARYAALFISSLLPALYIAFTSFHPGVMPTNIALSIAGSRGGVPFPAFIEALVMTFTLELLQEAGIRLPRVVGQTVSIVGGLVIGQAAVQAGVISPVMVIVIAITAISSFTIPNYSLVLTTRLLRIPFMLLATALGAYGTSIGILMLLGYVCSLESFGVGFLEPITPYRMRDWKDTIIRGPQKIFGKRPEFLKPEDTQRQIIKKGERRNEGT